MGIQKHHVKISLLALSMAALTGCNSMTALNVKQQPDEGIGYREIRFDEISQAREYQNCREEAFALDRKAMGGASAGGYLSSARLLEKCESRLGSNSGDVEDQERMQGYALSIQNYLKAGDLDQARANMGRFKQTFPDQDLYYPDGSSFIETMEVLMGQASSTDYGVFSVLNVSGDIKSEMSRQNYWKHN